MIYFSVSAQCPCGVFHLVSGMSGEEVVLACLRFVVVVYNVVDRGLDGDISQHCVDDFFSCHIRHGSAL